MKFTSHSLLSAVRHVLIVTLSFPLASIMKVIDAVVYMAGNDTGVLLEITGRFNCGCIDLKVDPSTIRSQAWAGHYGARQYSGDVEGLAGPVPDVSDRRQTGTILLMGRARRGGWWRKTRLTNAWRT
ncbi:hypothetical protein DFH08DRAFT_799636 [Mycena albidolilacea]|uniref:Uncharacterized protein n=1 Tax=Mycena albidolilacea TaxID=1033008 RepID=A0AAD7AM44_9AGAR|nr:hypothetical protein DFH08DRAFT_799636 [Mycena albidolilacea]